MKKTYYKLIVQGLIPAHRRAIMTMLLAVLFPATLLAENITLSGVVTDNSGAPLLGASVVEKGTTNGTTTGVSGEYSLDLERGDTITVGYLGYDSQEMVVESTSLDITLSSSTVDMDELVVVAYGTVKKRDMIGSVATIKSDELKASSGGNFQTALQGSAPGLQVVNNSITGEASQIKIRGVSSISSDTDPLWVVDGMIGGEDGINMNDIESIEVLKDASATAIYGSRGSNGVIIVTTKRGKKGDPSINLSYNFGLTPIVNENIGYANGAEALEILDTAYANVNGGAAFDPGTMVLAKHYSSGYETPLTREQAESTENNIYEHLTRLGNFHDVNLSISQANDKVATYFSANYRKDKSSLEGLDRNTISARVNTDYTKRNLKIGTQISGRYKTTSDISAWKYNTMHQFYPLLDPSSESGLWNPSQVGIDGNHNPLVALDPELNKNQTNRLSITANAYLNYTFAKVKGLSFRADGSIDLGLVEQDVWRSKTYSINPSQGTTGNSEKVKSWGSQYHAFFSYNKSFGKHNISAVAGTEGTRFQNDGIYLKGTNVIGSFQELASIGVIDASSYAKMISENYTLSLFSRLDYKFNDRYLLGASFVREGSSRFSEENRYGNFYSVSAGWIISEESFMESAKWISLLKLRGSFGETGNQNIPATATLGVYSSSGTLGYNYDPYMYLSSFANKSAKWEKTQSIDVGVDFDLLKGKISGSIAYYRQNISDMLLNTQVPMSAGIVSSGFTPSNKIWANVGDMKNEGVELMVNYHAISTKNFTWTTSANFTTNKNKVLRLDPMSDVNGTGIININPSTITKSGYSVGTYYMAKWAGVDEQTGVGMIYAIDRDHFKKTGETLLTGEKIPATSANLKDHMYIQEGKSGLPTYYGSWNNEFKYKNFDLSVSLYFSGGNYIYNETDQMRISDGRSPLKSEWLTSSWTQPGDNAKYPKLAWNDVYTVGSDNVDNGKQNPYNPIKNPSDFSLEKADFLKLRDITIGYTLPESVCKKIAISNMRLYLSMSNIATITGFSGYDPEMAVASSSSNKTGGIEFNYLSLPQTAIYSLGMNLNF